MINLTPIHQKIQKRMFEKMRVLGRANPATTNQPKNGELTHDKMATRSTFLRMTSGNIEPVILMGGKLVEETSADFLTTTRKLAGGFDEIYGPRSFITNDPTKNFEMAGENKNKRPMPGLKSIDASFKGGLRALREATINWTCWDWEELDYLMPHFLAHGKTVMVEWGWVYDKQSLLKLPNFLEIDAMGNRFISPNAYSDYKNLVTDADGDFDMMVGIIKNFEFTTRDDGGFDCQTILTSVGASIIEASEPNESAKDPNITYNLSIHEDTKETAAKIKNATGKTGTGEDQHGDKNSLINLNTSVSLKLLIKEIDRYLLTDVAKGTEAKEFSYTGWPIQNAAAYVWKPNRYMITIPGTTGAIIGDIKKALKNKRKNIDDMYLKQQARVDSGQELDFWVRWGWFEDNILSKFLSVTSNAGVLPGESYNPIITEFRSIEKKLNTDGDESGEYESVRIKNHPELQTMNANRFILPGQFYPAGHRELVVEKDKKPWILEGDGKFIHKLRDFTSTDFDTFSTGDETITRVEMVTEHFLGEQNVTNFVGPQREHIIAQIKTRQVKKTTQEVVVGKYGYLRNMLINTKLIRQAFGVDSADTFTVESINVVESIESLFSLLNQELNFWNFNITVDEIETNRAKIIDEQITNFDFKTPTSDQKSWLNESDISFEEASVMTNAGWEEGVFFFPVWQLDSIVKRQNITAKIPDAMQLAVMYGSNMDQLKDFANPGSQFADKEGVVAGGLYNGSEDAHKSGLDIAIRNPKTTKIGVQHGKKEKGGFIDDASIPLRPTGGKNDDIKQFLEDNVAILEKAFETRLQTLNDELRLSDIAKKAQADFYDDSVPPPFPTKLEDDDLIKLLSFEKSREGIFGWGEGKLTDFFGAIFGSGLPGANFGLEMKSQYKKSVNFLTTQHGIYKKANTPLLIPLELELDIDGIGGIYPGNSFHSTYVPSRYQRNTVFQIFDVNHKLSDTGWTVTLSGKMRATMDGVFKGYKSLEQLKAEQLENWVDKAEIEEKKRLDEPGEKLNKFMETKRKATGGDYYPN